MIAVRSINREEAYIEKQLEAILLAEVTYLVSLVQTELGRIESELADTAPMDPLADPGQAFAALARRIRSNHLPLCSSPAVRDPLAPGKWKSGC